MQDEDANDPLSIFVTQTEKQLVEFNKILLKYSSLELVNKKEWEIYQIVRNISSELEQKNVIVVLNEIRKEYFRKVVEHGEARTKFLNTLTSLSKPGSIILNQLMNNNIGKDWYSGETRQRAMEGIEILQTILFNEPGFCTKLGFLMEQINLNQSSLYLILGRDESKLNLDEYSKIMDMFSHITYAIFSILNNAKRHFIKSQPYHKKGNEEDRSVENVLTSIKSFLSYINDLDNRGFDDFLYFALNLSHEAIHEGHELYFLLGFGNVEHPETRCRKPINLPDYLRREGVNPALLVHFVKSYFSLFSHEDKILWFAQNGRYYGLYERSPEDTKEGWLEKWPSDCYFVRIKGKGKFDILEVDKSKISTERHRPRVRVEGDIIIDLKSTADIQYRTMVAAAQVFTSDPDRAFWICQLLSKVVDRLHENSQGAGLVVVNSAKPYNNSPWRVSIEEQQKSLVPDLEDLVTRIQFDGNVEDPTDDQINEICLLAKLDGAVLLRFERRSLIASPARQFLPLIDIKNKRNKRRLLDFYKLTEGRDNVPIGDKVAIEQLSEHLKSVHDIVDSVKSDCLGDKNSFIIEFSKCKDRLKTFDKLEMVKLYAACIRGLPSDLRYFKPSDPVREAIADLSFLNSSGTRHHSLWGITLSSKQRLFVVSLSQDGRVSVFWDGRFIPSIKPK